jgi:uncharacterized membrane protein YgcG
MKIGCYKLLILLFILSTYPFLGVTSECTILNPNSDIEILTSGDMKCVIFKNVSIDKSALLAIPTYQSDASYQIKAKLPSKSVILDEIVDPNDGAFGDNLALEHNTEVKLSIIPLTKNRSYRFWVVHDHDPEEGYSNVFLSVTTKVISEDGIGTFPDPRPCGPEGCFIPENTLIDSQVYFENQNVNTASEAAQCTAQNRPPEPPPRTRSGGEQLNVNSALRASRGLAKAVNNVFNPFQAFSMRMIFFASMSRAGGALDMSHDENSRYIGGPSLGNFLYGAHGRALGIPESIILRGSSGYQAITNHGWVGLPLGVFNFLTNLNDNLGDQLEVLRGIRYENEVAKHNTTDRASFSCLDDLTLDAIGSSGGGGGGGPGGGSDGGSSGGSSGPIGGGGYIRPGGGGEEWCFVQEGYPTYCWIE